MNLPIVCNSKPKRNIITPSRSPMPIYGIMPTRATTTITATTTSITISNSRNNSNSHITDHYKHYRRHQPTTFTNTCNRHDNNTTP